MISQPQIREDTCLMRSPDAITGRNRIRGGWEPIIWFTVGELYTVAVILLVRYFSQ